MSLATGTRLGAYEILAPLGSGGMGEVYRARDLRLNRDVAIKVLPAELSARPDALARFEREAQAVAALSHPNILAIHDFGRDDQMTYAVMELLDGESMRQRLARGALPARRAVEYAIQIARGLAAAHDKGIVHRDLKPENVFITADDRVKILDFGLARQEATSAVVGTLAPTQNSPTEPGAVLGTVGYMAPEQVRGAAVDSRADIFSFGVLLYEMVTGTRAFVRETGAETMTAILREDPPDVAPERGVPAAFERIIRRCLEKKAELRFRSTHDLAFALEALSGSSPAASSPALDRVPPPKEDVATAPPRRARGWLLPAAALVAIALAGAAGILLGRRQTVAPAALATVSEPPQFHQLTFDDAIIDHARFAPDGQTVVYGSRRVGGPTRLLLTRIESPATTPIPIDNAEVLAISRNAEMAVGLNPQGRATLRQTTLVRAPLLGGTSRPVAERVTFADWSPTGELAIIRAEGARQRLEFPIGTVLVESDGELGWPRISPDGASIAFLNWPIKDDDRGSVVIIDRTGARRAESRQWEALRGLAWTPAGEEVWYGGATSSSSYVIHALRPGQPERRVLAAPGGLLLYDITKDGKALVAEYDRTPYVYASTAGGPPQDVSILDGSFARDISRDGSRVVISYYGRGSSSNYDIYVRRLSDGVAARIGEGQPQQLSPDESSILAVIHGPPAKLVIHPVGSGEMREVKTGNVSVTQARWLNDMRHLLIVGTEPGKRVRAYVTDLAGAAPRPITPEAISGDPNMIALSHDARRAAFRSPEGVMTLYPTSGEAAVTANGFEADEMPLSWSDDDRTMLALTRELPRRLVRIDPVTGKRTIVLTLTPPRPTLFGPSTLMITPDGRSYVANYQERSMKLFVVEGLR